MRYGKNCVGKQNFLLQLRGEAGKCQVSGASLALQHNLGLGGAAVVTVYRKYQ